MGEDDEERALRKTDRGRQWVRAYGDQAVGVGLAPACLGEVCRRVYQQLVLVSWAGLSCSCLSRMGMEGTEHTSRGCVRGCTMSFSPGPTEGPRSSRCS